MTTRTGAPTFEDVIAGWDEAITCQFPPSDRVDAVPKWGWLPSIREYLYQRALAAGCVFGAR
jgi:hypothetical protein